MLRPLDGDAVYLDAESRRQIGADRRPARIGLMEKLFVDLVEGRKVVHITEVGIDLDHHSQIRPGGLQNGSHIVQSQPHLIFDRSLNHLARRRIARSLARDENQISGFEAL